ncbi:MAG: DNA repair protein RecO [Endozoicomonadaceae bacterium]|nr:DNA repair protein RecO [Endozoicomonadaceae bacterium]
MDTLAWILHVRPFKDQCLLIDLLTQSSGKITGVAYRKKKSNAALLQPFNQLYIHWQGEKYLKTLKKIEIMMPFFLKKQYLLAGLYLNELLVKVLSHTDAMPEIWTHYEQLMHHLSNQLSFNAHLRLFEKKLLAILGYALPLTHEAKSNTPIQPNAHYYFTANEGFYRINHATETKKIIPGWLLLQYHEDNITLNIEPILKYINQTAMMPLLGYKPLNSSLFFSNKTLFIE